MKRHAVLILLSVLLAGAFGACTDEPDFPSAPVFGNLVITNQTPDEIQVIRFRVTSPTSDIWGRNMVDEAQIQGNEAYLRMPPGTYDFHFESNDVNEFRTYTEVVITAGSNTYIVIQ